MEKVRREPVVKTSSMRIFNLVNTQSSQCIYEIFENKLFLKDHEKDNLIFSFTPSDFLWTKFWKAKIPETSYQSFWVATHACKNFFFGLTLQFNWRVSTSLHVMKFYINLSQTKVVFLPLNVLTLRNLASYDMWRTSKEIISLQKLDCFLKVFLLLRIVLRALDMVVLGI